jgi:predicted regulator of Ras-like GTPase activity (Roadblock/LC7/MglB family)
VDAARALADLTEISSQIETAAIVGDGGALLASTLEDDARAQRLAEGAARLLEEAASAATGREGVAPTQLEAATGDGSVFVVRDGGRTIVATTRPEPTVGLVFYDLKSCLRSLDEDEPPAPEPKAEPKPRPKRAPRKQEPADGAA